MQALKHFAKFGWWLTAGLMIVSLIIGYGPGILFPYPTTDIENFLNKPATSRDVFAAGLVFGAVVAFMFAAWFTLLFITLRRQGIHVLRFPGEAEDAREVQKSTYRDGGDNART